MPYKTDKGKTGERERERERGSICFYLLGFFLNIFSVVFVLLVLFPFLFSFLLFPSFLCSHVFFLLVISYKEEKQGGEKRDVISSLFSYVVFLLLVFPCLSYAVCVLSVCTLRVWFPPPCPLSVWTL